MKVDIKMKAGKLNEPYIAIMKDGKLSYGSVIRNDEKEGGL